MLCCMIRASCLYTGRSLLSLHVFDECMEQLNQLAGSVGGLSRLFLPFFSRLSCSDSKGGIEVYRYQTVNLSEERKFPKDERRK